MNELIKYSLNFELALDYISDELDNVNLLSSELLRSIDFKQGFFFSLLPKDANIEEKHQFKAGWILPPNPIEEYVCEGKICRYSVKKSIMDDLSFLILQEMNQRNNLSAVMDDVNGDKPKDEAHPCFFDNYTAFFQDEIYSLVTEKNRSVELISKCLKHSLSFWHSLGVLTTADLPMVDKELSLENIKDICLKTEVAFVGAYDGEGYVFWERNPPEGSRRYFEKNLKST